LYNAVDVRPHIAELRFLLEASDLFVTTQFPQNIVTILGTRDELGLSLLWDYSATISLYVTARDSRDVWNARTLFGPRHSCIVGKFTTPVAPILSFDPAAIFSD